MAFTDDDLQVIKEAVENGELNLQEFFKALLSRLDAAEKCCQIMHRFSERQEHPTDCRCDFCFALEAWRKSKGAA